MRQLVLCIVFCCLFSCAPSKEEGKEQVFGAAFTETSGKTLAELMPKASDKPSECLVQGKVTQVCQSAGCWLLMENPSGGEPIRVVMKEHAFSVPKDMAGSEILVKGRISADTISVDVLKKMAEDEGKSAEEIAKISSPVVEFQVEADGLKLINAQKK